jgi:hypothetical protein
MILAATFRALLPFASSLSITRCYPRSLRNAHPLRSK